jgi:hypothetical protein
VSQDRVVEFQVAALDRGLEYELGVDGSATGRSPVGAFGAVDGAGYAIGGSFVVPPALLVRGAVPSIVPELQALRVGLRRYEDGASVAVVMDSQRAAELLSLPLAKVRSSSAFRAFPVAAEEIVEHRRCLNLTHRMDFSERRGKNRARQMTVGQHPLMVGAHRLAYALLAFRVKGGVDALLSADLEWLEKFTGVPGRTPAKIRKAVNFRLGMRAEQAARERSGW